MMPFLPFCRRSNHAMRPSLSATSVHERIFPCKDRLSSPPHYLLLSSCALFIPVLSLTISTHRVRRECDVPNYVHRSVYVYFFIFPRFFFEKRCRQERLSMPSAPTSARESRCSRTPPRTRVCWLFRRAPTRCSSLRTVSSSAGSAATW